MARPDKAAAVAELTDKFNNSAGAVLTEYRGLTVAALRTLRRSLGDDATYAVSKNTLTTIAAREAGVQSLEEHLVGPTAIAFIEGDPVTVAKGLRDFARANPLLVIKGGVLDGKILTSDDVRRLADLESREVLLAMMAGAMQGALQNAVSLFAAPLSQAARVMAALESAAAENPSLIAGAGTPADGAQEPTTEGPADSPSGSAVAEPTNGELAADAAPAVEATEAAPAADATEAAPAADATEAAPAAEETTA
ncbi:MAG: LSU ribosomal protein L10p (P0) [uncultured Propionibacteriaceae bacterium]|uniref:Large ribosomal subunit protein uL10 n=1 Tax=uncultured Propionibacteriaceae bacterium TaxID=257457 RepID=A0A6J4P0J6_9ACTN|nr:MAG: LSU ribosomal protein L10p (P0) [uncultured Propionibacteriaceae bacterium]